MARNGLVAQTTREAPASPMTESGIAPTLLPVRCLCGKIRDETESYADREHWVTQRTYRQTHGEKLANFPLTHTYCPPCFTKFMETLRSNRREIGTSPWSCSPALRTSTPSHRPDRRIPSGTGPREGTVSPGA